MVEKYTLLSETENIQNIKHSKEKGKCFKPNNLIREAANNMNKTKNVKYNSVPEEVERKSLADDKYCKIYGFH